MINVFHDKISSVISELDIDLLKWHMNEQSVFLVFGIDITGSDIRLCEYSFELASSIVFMVMSFVFE